MMRVTNSRLDLLMELKSNILLIITSFVSFYQITDIRHINILFFSLEFLVCYCSDVNLTLDPNMLLKKYEATIKELKMELMMHDALASRSGVTYDEYTAEQKHNLSTQVCSSE